MENNLMPPPLKVLMLLENNPYPYDVRVRREAQALYQAGYQVAVIAPRLKDKPYHETHDDIAVYRYPMPPQGEGFINYLVEFGYSTLAMMLVSFWVWLSHGFDVIHAANPPDTLFIIGAFYKLFGKKFIYDHHDLAPETYLSRFSYARPNLIYRILLLLERLSFITADRVISTNESYRKVAITRGKKKPHQVFIVRNGRPLSFQPQPKDEELARRAKYIIGYIGIMGPQDGVDYWLRAIYELVYTLKRRDFLAVIIGKGVSVPSLKKLACDLKIEPYIWFTGLISEADVLRYLSTAHICVHPDPYNPLNNLSTMNKMMDYMALGKPVVSFDLVEARFSAKSAAIYAKPNDVLDFARKVEWLMNQEDERDRLGKIGRTRFAESLAWEYSVINLMETYRSLFSQYQKTKELHDLVNSRLEKIKDEQP